MAFRGSSEDPSRIYIWSLPGNLLPPLFFSPGVSFSLEASSPILLVAMHMFVPFQYHFPIYLSQGWKVGKFMKNIQDFVWKQFQSLLTFSRLQNTHVLNVLEQMQSYETKARFGVLNLSTFFFHNYLKINDHSAWSQLIFYPSPRIHQTRNSPVSSIILKSWGVSMRGCSSTGIVLGFLGKFLVSF